MVLVYDFDCPDATRNKIGIFWEALVFNILIEGLLQPLFAILVAVLICPVAAATIGLGKEDHYAHSTVCLINHIKF